MIEALISRRLALKISLVIVLIEVLVLGSLGVWYVARYASQVDRRLAEQVIIPGSLMQQGALRYGAVRDRAGLGQLIGQELIEALVIQADGRVFEASDPAQILRPAAEVVPGFEFDLSWTTAPSSLIRPANQPWLAQLSELKHDSGRVGWLYLRVDTSRAESEKGALA